MDFTPLLAATLASVGVYGEISVAQEYAEPAPAAEAAEVEPDIVDANADYYERMTVPVTIGDHGPFHFMIDTGSQATVVTESLRDQLGLDADMQPGAAAKAKPVRSRKPSGTAAKPSAAPRSDAAPMRKFAAKPAGSVPAARAPRSTGKKRP